MTAPQIDQTILCFDIIAKQNQALLDIASNIKDAETVVQLADGCGKIADGLKAIQQALSKKVTDFETQTK